MNAKGPWQQVRAYKLISAKWPFPKKNEIVYVKIRWAN